jgi:hypothetical protein
MIDLSFKIKIIKYSCVGCRNPGEHMEQCFKHSDTLFSNSVLYIAPLFNTIWAVLTETRQYAVCIWREVSKHR